jgi:hypothetical protein
MSIPVLFEIYKYRMRTNILHIIAALLVVLVILCMTRSEGFVSRLQQKDKYDFASGNDARRDRTRR